MNIVGSIIKSAGYISVLAFLLFHLNLSVVSAKPAFLLDVGPHHVSRSVLSPSKLSTELTAAMRSSATFEGTTENGQVVLSSSSELNQNDQQRRMRNFTDSVLPFETSTKNYDTIDEIVVFLINSNKIDDFTFSPWTVSKRRTRDGYVVLQSKEGFKGDDLSRLNEMPDLKYGEPNYRYRLAATLEPNDPYFTNGVQWGLSEIEAPLAWQSSASSSAIVAILDSGIDYNHEDLINNLWHGQNYSPTNRKSCGYDFVHDTEDPRDYLGHGTHCAGIIAAVANNGVGIAGLAQNVKLMALSVFGPDGATKDDYVGDAINFAIDNHARIINLSWNGPFSSVLVSNALRKASAQGILIIAAAGNEGTNNDVLPQYPASYNISNIISILALSTNENVWRFSNTGKNSVNMAAPGESIISCLPNNQYDFMDGTSMSAAFVSGAAALVLGDQRYLSLSAIEIKSLLLANSKQLNSLSTNCSSGGALNLAFLANRLPSHFVNRPPSPPSIAPFPNTNVPVHASGVLETPIFAIGGETTGFRIVTTNVNSVSTQSYFDLDFGDSNQLKSLAKTLNGKSVEVTGLVSNMNGIERKNYKVLKIETLNVLNQ